jgi:two-component system response regulator CpxR
VNVLIIDDDRELCGLLEELLRGEGFLVDCVHDGRAGLEHLGSHHVDLVILDVMLPRLDGLGVLRSLRRSDDVPVIMLTARGEDTDRIRGLELGADDYLPKPFNARELVARIRAVMRRRNGPDEEAGELLNVDGLSMDVAARQVAVDGKPLELTTLEFDILEILLRSAGRVMPRDRISKGIYGRSAGPLERTVDVHISRLRRKLGDRAESIRTIWGIGYQFARPGQPGETTS